MQRLFLGNIPSSTSASDLKGLVSKVCEVIDIYIPQKTRSEIRGFAIVVVNADESVALKCVKAFNNSIWKGVKLKVELSTKEYYKDKLGREWKEAEEERVAESYAKSDFDHLTEHALLTNESPRPPEVMRIRRYRGDVLVVSTTWRMTEAESKRRIKIKDEKKNKNCWVYGSGKKLKFSENGEVIHIQPSMEPKEEDLFDEKIDDLPVHPLKTLEILSKTKSDVIISKLKPEVQLPVAFTNAILPTPVVPPMTIAAKGRRVGFGQVEETKDKKSNGQTIKTVPFGDEGGDDETDESMDRRPSVLLSEISASALSNERQRARDIMANILEGGGVGKRKNQNSIDTSITSKSSLAKDSKTTSQAPASKISVTVSNGIMSFDDEEVKAVDVTDINSAIKLPHQLLRDTATTGTVVESKTVPESVSFSSIINSVAAVSVEVTASEGSDKPKDIAPPIAELSTVLVDSSTFKSIFHREGGLRWGDDGTLGTTVVVGDAVSDPLFVAAERLGQDTRPMLEKEMSTRQLTFGFFPDEPESAPAAVGVKAIELPLLNSVKLDSDLVMDEPAGVSGGVVDLVTPVIDDDTDVTPPASLLSVLENAMNFTRTENETVVLDAWRSSREKLAISYKRKRKEARKYTAEGLDQKKLTKMR